MCFISKVFISKYKKDKNNAHIFNILTNIQFLLIMAHLPVYISF